MPTLTCVEYPHTHTSWPGLGQLLKTWSPNQPAAQDLRKYSRQRCQGCPPVCSEAEADSWGLVGSGLGTLPPPFLFTFSHNLRIY